MQQIRVRTERRTQLLDITADVQAALDGTNGASGARSSSCRTRRPA